MSAPLPYVDWEVVKTRVAESLHVTASQLPSQWDGLCSQAAKDATVELRRIFVLKGYAVSRVESWDDREHYASRLATWFALTRGTQLASYDLKALEWLDPRKELSEASALIIGGVATAPAAGESDLAIQSGRLDRVDELLNPDSTGTPEWGLGKDWCW